MTDMMKLTVTFHSLVNAPKNCPTDSLLMDYN